MRRLEKQCELTRKKGEKGCNARLEGEFDIKSCISTLVLFTLIIKCVSYLLIAINYGATQFFVGQVNKYPDTVVVSVNETRGREDRLIKSEPGSGSHALDYAIKWFCIACGARNTNDDLVFLLVAPGLKCYVNKVPGLCKSMCPGGMGYVAFTKTRNDCAKFYQWFNMDHLIPFIEKLKQAYNMVSGFVFMFFDGD